MYSVFRSLLFRLEPEQAHHLTLALVRLAGRLPPVAAALRMWFRASPSPRRVFGLDFTNPVGLAAGYDKDGLAWRGLACLGFGHIEIGTVTPRPQPGNPKPRLFRLTSDQALINRLGFPGQGADFVAVQMRGKRPAGLVLGVNLGKNKDTPLDDAARDYLELLPIFAPLADYLAINVSSPNTVGLRRLQGREYLFGLLSQLAEARDEQAAILGRPVPLLVKLAPDLTPAELEDALDAVVQTRMDGVIAANTTIEREGLSSPLSQESGGLSGEPLRRRSTELVRQIHALAGDRLPVIGVGGVCDVASAREKLAAGAALVQIYTGLVYRGPGLIREIVSQL